jgi:PHP family Zn ribbon phosphoesterase
MWTCVFVEQKNLLGQQSCARIANHGLQPSDHKKQITACCSSAVHLKALLPSLKKICDQV